MKARKDDGTSAPGPGHNSEPVEVEGGQLRAFIERAERLNEEKASLGSDIKDLFAEAKGVGFDPKIIRKILSIRKRDPQQRAEEDALLETYLAALS